MMKFLYLLIFLITTISLHSQILTFDFSGLSGNEISSNSNTNDPNISISTITRGPGLTASNNGGRFNAKSWATGNIANAISGNDYMEFSITPGSGCNFSISSIFIQLERSATGPREITLRSSADGYSTNLDGPFLISDNTNLQSFTFTFAQNNITLATTYRIYMWAESTGGSGGPGDGAGNDIIVNGSTSCPTNTINLQSISPPPFLTNCGSGVGTNGSLIFNSVGTFNIGNIYSVELSDENGSFIGSTVIGSLASTVNSGTINFTIPSSTITGANYLIRIISNNPGATSNTSSSFSITQTNPCGLSTGLVSGVPFTVNCQTATTDAGTVAYTATAPMQTGNIYTIELSDEFGNFTIPMTIGSLTSTANSGSIPITIPSGLNTGPLFRVRIISSAPPMNGDSSAYFTITQMQPCVPNLPSSSGLIINEFSNGPSGNKEYYEFVVSGKCGDLVDIRGFILDDNNGTFTTPSAYSGTSSGIAPGHFRFSMAAQWANIPVGSLIVVYNKNDPNPILPPDDPTDANNDSLYVVPHNNALFEYCTTMPKSASPDSIYTPCSYSVAPLTGWNPLSIRNGGDAIQVRSPNGDYFHGISYGGASISGGPHNLKLFTGSGSGMVGWFNSGDFYDISEWSSGSIAGNETPGLPNNAANLAWLRLMRDPLSTNCPVTVLPVELYSFTGVFNSIDANDLSWSTLSERNASHYFIERSTDGVQWEKINYQNAIGNTTTESSYTYSDRTYIKGKVNYYRLNQTDFNGINTLFKKHISIDDSNSNSRNLVRIINSLGQEIDEDEKGIQIHLYDDGTIERIYKM